MTKRSACSGVLALIALVACGCGGPSSPSSTALQPTIVNRIAVGSTAITVSDASGTSVAIPVSGELCGRPDNIYWPTTQLIYPKQGSTGISTSIGKLYFGVVSVVAPQQVSLHMFFGSTGAYHTIEGGTLQVDTPPPGSATVAPGGSGSYINSIVTYMSVAPPPLQPGTTYTTQIFDDSCQPAIVTGSFST